MAKATYAGSHMEYRIDTQVGQIFVVFDVDTYFQDGDSISVSFMEKGPVLLPRV